MILRYVEHLFIHLLVRVGLLFCFDLCLFSIYFALFFQLGKPMSLIGITYRSLYLTDRGDTLMTKVVFQNLSIAYTLYSFCFAILGVEPGPPTCQTSAFTLIYTPFLKAF